MSLRSCLVFVALSLAVSTASAQSGGLTVRVFDATGLPLPGATVTISHSTGYVNQTSVAADAKGQAEFPVLRPGKGYVVEVAFPGFGTRRVTGIHVAIGGNQRVDVQLTDAVEERIQVGARTDPVDVEETSQTTRFSDEFMADLPVPGRFYQNVLALAPGVQDADGDGNPNVHGSRDRDFKAIVSGVANVDPLTGQQMSQVNPSSIEEMQVITAGAGVEFSRAQGGFARIIQKQGSNEFEGVAEFYFRSSRLDGDGAAGPTVVSDPEFDWYQPSFQVSGPIVKDKLWYRLSHELIERENPINITTGIAVQTDDQEIHSDQITWQLSPRNKLAYQFQSDPRRIDNFGVSSTTPAESTQSRERTSAIHSLTWTAPVSPKILVESQAAWQDLNTIIAPSTRGIPNRCVDTDPSLQAAQCLDLDTGQLSGSYFRTLDDHSQRFTVRSQAEVFGGRFWGMSHQVKVGLLAENERYFRFLERRPDLLRTVFFPEPIVIGNMLVRPPPVLILFARAAVPDRTNVRATGTNWGLYAEDSIRPRQNLSIRLGLRADREEINSNGFTRVMVEDEARQFLQLVGSDPSASQANFAANSTFTGFEDVLNFVQGLAVQYGENPDAIVASLSSTVQQSRFWRNQRRAENVDIANTNISPAIAVSWDPWSDNKTRVAFTARRYYDKIFLGIPLIELEPVTTDLVFEAEGVRGPHDLVFDVPDLRGSINSAVNVSVVDRELATPYQDELTFSFEREIAAETTIGLSYINRKFRDQFQDTDINHLPGDFGRCRVPSASNPSHIQEVRLGDPDYIPGVAPGDGILDDCAGETIIFECHTLGTCGEFFPRLIEVPDGLPDLYVQNPGWGDMFEVGNFNRIDYKGVVLALTRRQYRGWEMQLSYTWSQAKGDGEDFNQTLGDDRSLLQDERGFQSYDQRHAVKLNGTTITPWGFRLGTAISWQSGLPFSLLTQGLAFHQVPIPYRNLGTGNPGRVRTKFPTHQRNDQRNASYWNVDVKLAKELNLGRRLNAQFSAEVFNLLNDDTYTIWDPLTASGQQVNGTNTAFRRFGRRWQLGLKLAF